MKNNHAHILVRGLHVVIIAALLAISPASLALGLRPAAQTTTTAAAIQTCTNTTSTQFNQDFSVRPPNLPRITLNRTQPNFGAVLSGAHTDFQALVISNSGGGTLTWEAVADQAWLTCNPISGSGSGAVTVSIDPSGLSAGTHTGVITVLDPNASNSPQTVNVNLNVYALSSTNPPFGSFNTPIDGSTVSGSIPVSGWALDDVGVESVKIYREEDGNLPYIGDAVFVEGSRPDVEHAYPGYPMNYRAGWGYMLLTNFLPNGGNGTYTLHAIATDLEGNQTTLGTKTIHCDNANAVKPFGAIDTPTQGGAASGCGFINWGWVLTPQPNAIPTDGSTINVWVDDVNLGNPTYNVYRHDIADLFPGYANSDGAAGYFSFDTTIYADGVHTIYWTATDSGGNTDGIGSRYFTINNCDGSSKARMASPPSCNAEIDIQGTNYQSIANGDPEPSLELGTDFGSTQVVAATQARTIANHTAFGSGDVAVGTVVRTFVIENTGPGILHLPPWPDVVVSGPHASDFVVTTQPSSPVPPGETTYFVVAFNPTACGLREAALSIANNDADEYPFVFDIQGRGIAPDLTAAKSNNVGGITALGNPFQWTVTVANSGDADAAFTDGQNILTDDLPNSTISYGIPSVANATDVANWGDIGCQIVAQTLTCSVSGDDVTIGAATGSFDVQFSADPSAIGIFDNPRAGGRCQVDPDGHIIEGNEDNNTAADSVAVGVGTITIVKDAAPDDAQDFSFTGDVGDFDLDDDDDPTLPNSSDFVRAVGSYQVTESPPADWNLAVIRCDDPDGETTTDLGAGTATIDLDLGEHVTCTFTNTLQLTLTVDRAGSGAGTVTSDPAGIDCGVDCTEIYNWGALVALTATADANSAFEGWSGDCSGANPTITVTMDADKTCTATFRQTIFWIYLPLILKSS